MLIGISHQTNTRFKEIFLLLFDHMSFGSYPTDLTIQYKAMKLKLDFGAVTPLLAYGTAY